MWPFRIPKNGVKGNNLIQPSTTLRQLFVAKLSEPSICGSPLWAYWVLLMKPMDTTSEPRQQPEEVSPNAIEFKSVLLVDDDRELAESLQWILADEHFMVEVAHDGAEALEKIGSNQYDAVICDVMMPKLRGDELFQRAVEIRPMLKDWFIFITGFAANPAINLFLSKTGAKYFMKPFRVQTLIECVRQQTVQHGSSAMATA